MSRKAARRRDAVARERARRLHAEDRRQDQEIDAAQQADEAGIDPPPDPRPPIDPRPTPAAPTRRDVADTTSGDGKRIPGQLLTCGWCGNAILIRHTGRLPKWCSASCRQRAWETDRTHRSGRAAVRVVDRYIHAVPNTTDGWVQQLATLAGQLEHQGNLDLNLLGSTLAVLQQAITERTRWREDARHW